MSVEKNSTKLKAFKEKGVEKVTGDKKTEKRVLLKSSLKSERSCRSAKDAVEGAIEGVENMIKRTINN